MEVAYLKLACKRVPNCLFSWAWDPVRKQSLGSCLGGRLLARLVDRRLRLLHQYKTGFYPEQSNGTDPFRHETEARKLKILEQHCFVFIATC